MASVSRHFIIGRANLAHGATPACQIKGVVQGYTSQQISQKIFRSIHTVRSHRKNILEKSDCENITELVAKAVREGWV